MEEADDSKLHQYTRQSEEAENNCSYVLYALWNLPQEEKKDLQKLINIWNVIFFQSERRNDLGAS